MPAVAEEDLQAVLRALRVGAINIRRDPSPHDGRASADGVSCTTGEGGPSAQLAEVVKGAINLTAWDGKPGAR
jgi:hypothetical protein